MADAPIIKAIVLIVFALIVISLGSAFFSLFRRNKPGNDRPPEDDNSTVKALTLRVALSVALVLTLVILNALGIIEPNG